MFMRFLHPAPFLHPSICPLFHLSQSPQFFQEEKLAGVGGPSCARWVAGGNRGTCPCPSTEEMKEKVRKQQKAPHIN